jgi:ribonuclease VapC
MVIDSSALIAILTLEPEARRLVRALTNDPVLLISTATLVETSIVASTRFGDEIVETLELFLAALAVEIVPFTVQQAALARRAHQRYGKGRHPAGLNFGDCFAYALANDRNEPLLFKGNDFARTDIVAVPY